MSVTEQPTRVWCPTCEETQLSAGLKRCAWCDTELQDLAGTRRYKRRKDSKWTDLKVNQCYEAYQQGHSVNQIAAVIWESMGYKSLNACSNNLYREFKLAGFPLRSQSAVTASRNFKHGRATREGRIKNGDGAYRRWFKEQNGRYNPKCPECARPAMDGDEFCFAHSPDRAEQRAELCAAMRENRTQVFVPGGDHIGAKLTDAQAQEILDRTGENRNALAAEFDVTYDTVRNIQIGVSWKHLDREDD